ncbi:uncharacterized protein G2W53_024863 [Senna tora]|uniref:Uncharacterized protein n=1 Tax=Senna tora TaxID=362788 RepID=A0A834WFW4_9FABA|nr:uncharacterized protein G2W53_024863 [Senna tora]
MGTKEETNALYRNTHGVDLLSM